MTPDQFWKRIDKSGACWVYTGRLSQGYGRVGGGERYISPVPSGAKLAHRISYELLVGPIPEGLQLDHLCRNRACVNPEHLEPVTCAENVRRGANGELRTHCKQGHEFTPENTLRRKTGYGRVCKTCRDQRNAEGRRRPQTVLPEACRRGHPMVGDNLKPDGARFTCRECAKRRCRETAARRKAREQVPA